MSATTNELHVLINGEGRTVQPGATLPDVLREQGLDPSHPRGIAVAVNDEVVRKQDWGVRALREGDRIEIVTANAGG